MGMAYMPNQTILEEPKKLMRFVLTDGESFARCAVTGKALLAAAGLANASAEELKEIFLTHLPKIQRVAERKYEAGQCEETGTFLVRASDLR